MNKDASTAVADSRKDNTMKTRPHQNQMRFPSTTTILAGILAFLASFALLCSIVPVAHVDAADIVPAENPNLCQNEFGWADWSHASDGYVTLCYTAQSGQRLRATVGCPDGQVYAFDLVSGEETCFTLSGGDGTYTLKLLEEISPGTKQYYIRLKDSRSVTISDPLAPYLASCQYVDYGNAPQTVKKAQELCTEKDTAGRIQAVYQFVIDCLTYDHDLASNPDPIYVPDLDADLGSGKGICFDYASLMCGMLRSQGVPCRLELGWADQDYHAWVSVWNGADWVRMDPTFADSMGDSPATLAYIGDDSHYTAERFY